MSEPMILSLDLALTRWSVMCTSWGELAAGHSPILGAFLAGWYCRCCATSKPENEGAFQSSFRVGWREADGQIEIASRNLTDKLVYPICDHCGDYLGVYLEDDKSLVCDECAGK